MGSILNETDRAAICNRMRSLSVSSTGRWGSMDVTGMLKHLHLSALMALGTMEVPSANKRAFHKFPLKHLLLYVLPFPKGAPTAPKLKPEAAASIEEERAALLELLEPGVDRHWLRDFRDAGPAGRRVWRDRQRRIAARAHAGEVDPQRRRRNRVRTPAAGRTARPPAGHRLVTLESPRTAHQIDALAAA